MGLILICLYCFLSDQTFSERGIPLRETKVHSTADVVRHWGNRMNLHSTRWGRFFSLPYVTWFPTGKKSFYLSAWVEPPPSYMIGFLPSPGSQLANKVSTSAQYLSAEQNPDLPQRDNAPNTSSKGIQKFLSTILRMMTIKKTPLQSLQYFGFTSPKVYIPWTVWNQNI